MDDPFQRLFASDARLRHVVGHFYLGDPGEQGPPMLTAISLEFDDTRVLLVAQEDDSIAVTDGAMHDSDQIPTALDDAEPWSSAISKPLLWAWRMVNQQGYFDGVQLEFAADIEQPVKIQLLVIGSQIHIHVIGRAIRIQT